MQKESTHMEMPQTQLLWHGFSPLKSMEMLAVVILSQTDIVQPLGHCCPKQIPALHIPNLYLDMNRLESTALMK